jgi:hypothetical protein
MHSTKGLGKMGINALAVAGWMFLFSNFPSVASALDSRTVIGTIVEFSPDSRTLLLRVGFSEGVALLRRFETAESTRFRVNGGFGRPADVLVGQTARVTYNRTDDANLAELVEITDVPPASSVFQAAGDATDIESRRRYLDGVASTLDVLEESVGELRQHPDVKGTDEQARLRETIDELEAKLATSRAKLSSLSATSSQEAWRQGVAELSAVLEDLTLAYERGASILTNR